MIGYDASGERQIPAHSAITEMKICEYLGEHSARLFSVFPFNGWNCDRSVEMQIDRPCIDYEFTDKNFAVICDLDETIRTLFLYSDEEYGISFTDLPPLTATQREVRELLGAPSKRGEESSSPVLGKSGAWDRFAQGAIAIHVQYKVGSAEIEMVTLTRTDSAP